MTSYIDHYTKTNSYNIDPNMELLESWLRINKETVKHDKLSKEAHIKYINLMKGSQNFTSREDQTKIYDNHQKYCVIDKIPIQKIFHKDSETPSEFMKDFIEATYNLFQIQQNRIDELETRLYLIDNKKN